MPNNSKWAKSVAYFCAEFGIDSDLPTYSGGLGILAGDYMNASADLDLKTYGVGILYKGKSYVQHLTAQGKEEKRDSEFDYDSSFLRHTYLNGKPIEIDLTGGEGVIIAKIYQTRLSDNTIMYLSGTPTWQPGKFGNCLEFVEAEVESAQIDALAAYRATKQFTIAFWINQVSGYRNRAFDAPGIQIHDFRVTAFGLPWTGTGLGFGNDGLWHHVGFVFDPYDPGGFGKRVYVDGSLIASNVAYDTDSAVLGDSWMRLAINSATYAWSGSFDDLAVWDVALPADAFESLWNEGAGRIVALPPQSVFMLK